MQTIQQTAKNFGDLSELQNYFLTGSDVSPDLGVECEWPICDKKTAKLLPLFDDIYDQLPAHIQKRTQPEFFAWQLEYATSPHPTVQDIRIELKNAYAAASQAANNFGAELPWKASDEQWAYHPKMIRPSKRASYLQKHLGSHISKTGTCGLHVHVQVSQENAIQVLNGMQSFVPLLVALSANSPTMAGRQFQASSHRAAVWANELPTSGFPQFFDDWDNFNSSIMQYRKAGIINSQKDLHSFVRPTRYGTIEIRCTDLPRNLETVVGITALTQALAVKIQRDLTFCIPRESLQANLVNAIMDGPNAIITRPRSYTRVSIKECLEFVIQELRDIPKELGSEVALERLQRGLTAHDRHLKQSRTASTKTSKSKRTIQKIWPQTTAAILASLATGLFITARSY